MSKVLNFVFFILFAGFAAAASAGVRHVRSSGSQGGSGSYSSSSSSSGSGSLAGSTGGNLGGGSGGGAGDYGSAPHSGATGGGGGSQGFGYPGNFIFPGTPGFVFPGFSGFPGFPVPNFMNPYQQWLAQFNAAQRAAQQQAALHQANMAALLAQHQAAAAQQPTVPHGSAQYPNIDSNALGLDSRIGSSNPGSGSGGLVGSSYSGSGSFGSGSGTSGNPDFVFTGASIGIGPHGGHGEAASFPGGPDGLGVRISEDYDPPSQPGMQGVFTSSSSGTSTVNGKTTSFKTSTFGKNDNGKITFRTINE